MIWLVPIFGLIVTALVLRNREFYFFPFKNITREDDPITYWGVVGVVAIGHVAFLIVLAVLQLEGKL